METKKRKFIDELIQLTIDYDGDMQGAYGYSREEIEEMLKKEYPNIFYAYTKIKED